MKKIFNNLIKILITTTIVIVCFINFATADDIINNVSGNENNQTTNSQVGDSNPCTTQTSDFPCVVAPQIAKPDLLPGPSIHQGTEGVVERYFITRLMPTLIRGAINILGGITVIALMWGGVQYLTAYGDDTKIENAKNTITYSIIGLFIALFSYTIVSIISDTPLTRHTEQQNIINDDVVTATQ